MTEQHSVSLQLTKSELELVLYCLSQFTSQAIGKESVEAIELSKKLEALYKAAEGLGA